MLYLCRMKKKCYKCGDDKSPSEFYKDKSRKDGIANLCKICDKEKWKNNSRKRNNIIIKDYYGTATLKASDKGYQTEYTKRRKDKDPIYKTKTLILSSIHSALSHKNHKKKSRTRDILGISIKEFKEYLELKFEDWMTWDNHGEYNGDYNHGWDLDHIIPISSAKTEEDIIRLNHHTNFQPLCSKVNRFEKKDNY